MPSELETAMESLIKVFHRYASKEGRSGTLNRRELRELMENELSNFLMVRKHQNLESKSRVSRIIASPDVYRSIIKFSCRCPPHTLSLTQSQKDPAAVDKIMKDLDTNGDGQVDFEEFVSLVVGLSIACEQCYQMHMKKAGKK